jgi:hypothetical protein
MRSPALTVVLLLAAGGRAAAQDCLNQIRYPEVGRWAEYKAVYNGKDPSTIRYAVIGEEKRGGKSLKWVELRITGEQKDKTFIYQMLVPGSPAEMAAVQEVVFKPGEQPAMKMSGMMLSMIRGQMEKQNFFSEVCKDVTPLGTERVTVPAGKFQARHFHSAKYNADSWLSSAVPFSLVKSTGKTYQMELTVHGKGAKSSITEEPREMEGMSRP